MRWLEDLWLSKAVASVPPSLPVSLFEHSGTGANSLWLLWGTLNQVSETAVRKGHSFGEFLIPFHPFRGSSWISKDYLHVCCFECFGWLMKCIKHFPACHYFLVVILKVSSAMSMLTANFHSLHPFISLGSWIKNPPPQLNFISPVLVGKLLSIEWSFIVLVKTDFN